MSGPQTPGERVDSTPARSPGITPDDPRHGTYAGSIAHYLTKTPTCQPCRDAAATYRRNRRARLYLARTTTLEVNPIGSIRRIRALVALGHSMRVMDDRLGWTWGTTSRFITARHQTTHRTTADRITAMYDELCMTVPKGPYATRNRKLAERHGWAPPLAWTNIDDPDDKPRGVAKQSHRRRLESGRHHDDVDEVVVERLLAGHRTKSTRAEKDEAMRRWLAAGNSRKSLCDLHGWHEERYGKDTAA